MQLYLLKQPTRAFVIVSVTHALILGRPSDPDAPITDVSVALLPIDHLDLSNAQKLGDIHGCLGLLTLSNEMFLGVVTAHTPLGNILPEEHVSRIVSVSFHCLTSSIYDDLPDPANANDSYSSSTTSSSSSTPYNEVELEPVSDSPYTSTSASASTTTTTTPGAAAAIYDAPTAPIRKILSSGQFYFSSNFDLSTRLEARIRRGDLPGCPTAVFDPRFLWNHFLVSCLLKFRDNLSENDRDVFDQNSFLVLLIHGFVGTIPLSITSSSTTSLSIVSRQGCNRAGTRFNTRGIDDNGDVANFVETEVILYTSSVGVYSHVQLRGSIPLFWDQSPASLAAPLSLAVPRVTLTRPDVASRLAFDLHFTSLIEEYGHVDIISLLGTKEGENILENGYRNHWSNSSLLSDNNTSMCEFDFHAKARLYGYEGIRDLLQREPAVAKYLDSMSHCLVAIDHKTREVVYGQKGVFRVNCLDCLDRTNVTQDMLSQLTLGDFLRATPLNIPQDEIWSAHRTLWAENGDALSHIYAGTGALNTSFTRTGRKTLAGVLSDATKSVSRMYQSNFNDQSKQFAIDSLLGRIASQEPARIFDPIHTTVQTQLNQRLDEFSSTSNIKIWSGTFNLNGYPPGPESLTPWIFPTPSDGDPDIYAFGFQEIVQLTPGQIVATDPSKKAYWEATIMKTFEKHSNKKGEYVVLRSEQLVGTALIIIIKVNLIGSVKNVEASTKKTGFRGMAGNKGGVAIRLEFHDTSICFVTAHLAAGTSNVNERNMDYFTIAKGLQFLRGKSIEGHDQIIWMGDFNYRVNMTNEEARQLIDIGQHDDLLVFDQLMKARNAFGVFDGYYEAPITFRPTYKYDAGTNNFDSSEKQRIPSWTDRILIKGEDLDMTWYSSADVKFSDHRPVFALIRARVRKVDAEKKKAISEEIFQSLSLSLKNGKVDEFAIDQALKKQEEPPIEWWDDSDLFIVNSSKLEELSASRDNSIPNPFDDKDLLKKCEPLIGTSLNIGSKSPKMNGTKSLLLDEPQDEKELNNNKSQDPLWTVITPTPVNS